MTHYHFIGIGGAGLSPIARFLLERGHKVSGSDLVLSPAARELVDMGVEVFVGHDSANISKAQMVIRSSAIPDSNPEVLASRAAGIPVIKRVDFLSELTAGKKVIAVAGTHGKTTTTAMLAWCLAELGMDPSYIIGGISKNLKTNAHAGNGEYFVIEADEYDGMFLGLTPDILVLTIIEYDHPDCYPTPELYFNAFLKLVRQVNPGGLIVANGDKDETKRLMKAALEENRVFSVGERELNQYSIQKIHHLPGCGVSFKWVSTVATPTSISDLNIKLALPGVHNAHNAASVLAVIHQLGLPLDLAKKALESFSGTGRRYENIGIADGITVIDDYAHHPTEIRATLAAARCQYSSNQIWAVWQPHTYSRTQQLLIEFSKAFKDCDHVIVTEIYASREKVQDYSSSEVVKLMDHPDARHIADLDDVSAFLINYLKKGDVLIVLSAGDADRISRDVFSALKARKEEIHD